MEAPNHHFQSARESGATSEKTTECVTCDLEKLIRQDLEIAPVDAREQAPDRPGLVAGKGLAIDRLERRNQRGVVVVENFRQIARDGQRFDEHLAVEALQHVALANHPRIVDATDGMRNRRLASASPLAEHAVRAERHGGALPTA